MVDATALFDWGQVVFLAASLPLAAVAAWGYREAPVGRAIAALPAVSAGFLVSASDELLGTAIPGSVTAWQLGSAVAALGFVFLAVEFLRLVSGRRRVGR